jgi:serine/threonine-protein kinase
MLVGTAAYLSPEQASGRDAGPTSDVYSLGVVTYECLSGARPFVADSAIGVAMAHATTQPPALPSTVPPVVDDFVMRALSKDPSRRQPSAADFGRTALALAAQMHTVADPTAAAAAATPTATPIATAVMPTTETADASQERERRRIRNVFVATGAAVVLVGFLLLHSCTDGGIVHATVPNVLGQTYAAAAKSLQGRGFHVVRTTRSSSAAPDTVIAEKPTGSVQEGATVTLTVATAPVVTPATPAPHEEGGPKDKHGPKPPPHGHDPKQDNQNGD